MAFTFLKVQPNGATSMVHAVHRIEMQGGSAQAIVNSYATINNWQSAAPMLNWQQPYDIPAEAMGNAEGWLVSPEGSFPGGALIAGDTDLAFAKSVKWGEMKQRRDKAESDGFPYLGMQFDSDSRSVQRITVAVMAAQAALAAGQPFEMDWTAADNSSVTLTAEQMLGMPAALAIYGNELHRVARQLREQIEAAQTVAEVDVITWPMADQVAPAPPSPPAAMMSEASDGVS